MGFSCPVSGQQQGRRGVAGGCVQGVAVDQSAPYFSFSALVLSFPPLQRKLGVGL